MSGPISISQNGKSISTATQQELLFNTAIPFAKIDSTKKASFQVINILFGHEPPDPATPTSVPTYSNTFIYSFPHGYDYVPSTWFLISLDGFVTTIGAEGSVIKDGGGGIPLSSNAKLNVVVDDTNISFYVLKQRSYIFGTPDPAPHVIGLTTSIRVYVFAEDLTGTSLPDVA